MFYLIITGSRTYTHQDHIYSVISELMAKAVRAGHDLTVIHGAAKGADSLASEAIRQYGQFNTWEDGNTVYEKRFQLTSSDWKAYGKLAGFLRNQEMVNWALEQVHQNKYEGGDESLIYGAAFYHESGPTGGTRDCHARLKETGIPTRAYAGTALTGYDPGIPVPIRHFV